MSQRRIPSLGALAKKVAKLIQEGSVELSDIGNSTSISIDIVIPDNYNTVLYGPITINSGVSFTIGSNSSVKIIDISDV